MINNAFLGSILAFPAPSIKYELQCFWNDNAAHNCIHDPVANTITVFTPTSPGGGFGNSRTLFITFYRQVPIGMMDFTYLWTPTTPAASLINKAVMTYKTTSAVGKNATKNVVT